MVEGGERFSPSTTVKEDDCDKGTLNCEGGDLGLLRERATPPFRLPFWTKSRVLAERLLSGRGGGIGAEGDSDKRRADPGSGRGTETYGREAEEAIALGIDGGGMVGSDKKLSGETGEEP